MNHDIECIVDKYNQHYPGWINYKSEKKIGYKELKNGNGETLGIEDVKAFSIAADSFVTIHYHNFSKDLLIDIFSKVILKGPTDLRFKTTYRKPIPRLLQDNWKTRRVKLFLIRNEESTLALTKENFYERMPILIGDDAALRAKILTKELSYTNINKVIREYEIWQKNKK